MVRRVLVLAVGIGLGGGGPTAAAAPVLGLRLLDDHEGR
jgi:hypothetical protein